MNNKGKIIYIFLGVASLFLLIMTFFSNKINFSSMIKASVSDVEMQNNEVIYAAKKMAMNNIDEIKGEVVYTVKELIRNKYLTGNEINPTTGEEYDDNTRIVVVIKNNQIEDAYITNILFKSKFTCENVCYLDFDNYISFNNETYRILKIDQQGYLYITKNDIKKVNSDKIDSYFKNLYNSLDKNIVKNVISLSDSDIEKSNMIYLDDKIIVNSNTGYKIYNVDDNKLEKITNSKVKVYPIIVLNNDLTYEKGTGSKFNPYILGE